MARCLCLVEKQSNSALYEVGKEVNRPDVTLGVLIYEGVPTLA